MSADHENTITYLSKLNRNKSESYMNWYFSTIPTKNNSPTTIEFSQQPFPPLPHHYLFSLRNFVAIFLCISMIVRIHHQETIRVVGERRKRLLRAHFHLSQTKIIPFLFSYQNTMSGKDGGGKVEKVLLGNNSNSLKCGTLSR